MTGIWRRAIWVAIALYGLLAVVQIRQKPGLQYDEALLVLGSVHMRHLPHQEINLPHDPDTWIRIRSRWFPLMTVRYVGAVKEYLGALVFALFGVRTSYIRLLSLLLGAAGIWGIAFLLREQVEARVAALVAFALAINPTYVGMTTFDNGTVSTFMASLGLMCVAIAWYLRRRSLLTALALGLAIGLGAWARVNFLWLTGSVFVAVALTLRKRLLEVPWTHWVAALAGFAVGSLPLTIYQIVSHGGTFEALGMFSSPDSLGHRLLVRTIMFSESLLTDREHRAMWAGPAMPRWQRWLFPTVVLASCAVCLRFGRSALRTILPISFFLFGATLFFSGLIVSEHHLVALLPFAATITVLAGFTLIERFPRARWGVLGLAIVYLCCAFAWQFAAVAGLKKTGGVGVWSDGVVTLATRLEEDYATTNIKILDWGLQNSLYVMTDARIAGREIYGDATPQKSGLNRSWTEEVRDGGVFLLFAPPYRQMPVSTNAFLDTLAETTPVTHRVSIPERDGSPFAEVIEVEPNTLQQGSGSRIAMGNPRFAGRLEGFYQIEEGRWRWTQPKFAVSFYAPPRAATAAARLSLDIYLPDVLVQKMGKVTISASVAGHPLPPETWQKPGAVTYAREVPAAWLNPGVNRIEFAVARSFEADGRELGVVLTGASLEAGR
jgi:hypothetical protein